LTAAGRHGDYRERIAIMNVLVVGYGSIGKRHVSNLASLDCIDKIIIYTKVKNGLENKCEKKNIFIDAAVLDLTAVANRYEIDFAIIANETCKHIDAALILAEKGIHLFVEKPLSHNLEKIELLKEFVQKKQIKVFVAYNLRYLPAIQYLKNQLAKKIIGALCFAEIEVGQYLPEWRPLRDYRKSYSAREERGGGVALDLSHEIDYMRYLFGDPVLWKTMKSRASSLEIDSADIFKGIYRFSGGFMCSVNMDYIRRDKKRRINIIGQEGSLECDLIKKFIKIQKNSGEISVLEDARLFDVDESYRSELSHFIEGIGKDKTTEITLDDGIEVLKLIGGDHA
jgi:predicted dehydrogenase